MDWWMEDLYRQILIQKRKISDLGVTPLGHVFHWNVEENPGYGTNSGAVTVQEYIDELQNVTIVRNKNAFRGRFRFLRYEDSLK